MDTPNLGVRRAHILNLLRWNGTEYRGSSRPGPAHRGEMTPEIVDELRRTAERIVNSPNAKRADQFRTIADRETKLIDERIAAPVRLREKQTAGH